MPLCVFFMIASYDYVADSWGRSEVSDDAGGLPYPFLPLLKSILLVMPVAVALQGIAMLLRSITVIRGR